MMGDASLTGCLLRPFGAVCSFVRGVTPGFTGGYRHCVLSGRFARHAICLALSGRLIVFSARRNPGRRLCLALGCYAPAFQAEIMSLRDNIIMRGTRQHLVPTGQAPIPSRLCFEVKSEKLSQVAVGFAQPETVTPPAKSNGSLIACAVLLR